MTSIRKQSKWVYYSVQSRSIRGWNWRDMLPKNIQWTCISFSHFCLFLFKLGRQKNKNLNIEVFSLGSFVLNWYKFCLNALILSQGRCSITYMHVKLIVKGIAIHGRDHLGDSKGQMCNAWVPVNHLFEESEQKDK